MSDRLSKLARLLENEPGDRFCPCGTAQEYAKFRQPVQAVEFFQRTIKADPEHCYAFDHIGRTLASLGRASEPDCQGDPTAVARLSEAWEFHRVEDPIHQA